MAPLEINGWKIYLHPLIAQQEQQLRHRSLKLEENLTQKEYKRHETVKLFTSLTRSILEFVPANPEDKQYELYENLHPYKRLKGKGLPDRYRIFFRLFSDKKTIVFLWLGYPRKDGSKDDCYAVFARMIAKKEFPSDVESLIAICEKVE